MTLVRWSPVQQLASMEVERLNRMFDRMWGGEPPSLGWVPPVDIFEDEHHNVVMRAELPGMKREDIHLAVENDTLTLSGERRAVEEIRHDRYHRLERQAGEFRRSFTLPSLLDTARIEARYEDGVLTITIPPREEARPKQIPVQAS
jgi:HSP20 family protein